MIVEKIENYSRLYMEGSPEIKTNPFQLRGRLSVGWKVALGLLAFIFIGFLSIFVFSLLKKTDDSLLSEEDKLEQQREAADLYLSKIQGVEDYVKVALVGKEYLFEEDLKAYFSSQGDIGDYENNQDKKDEALDFIIDQSIALQEGEKEGWVFLDESIFNNPEKDFEKRSETVATVGRFFAETFLGEINYEACTVWYDPTSTSPFVELYGLEAAKNKAREKIEYVQIKVKKGEISMKQAGDILKNDPEVQQMNPDGGNFIAGYSSASYYRSVYNYYNSDNENSDIAKEKYETILELKAGEVSSIIDGKDIRTENGQQVTKNVYYAFFRSVNSGNGYPSYDLWIEAVEPNYIIEKY